MIHQESMRKAGKLIIMDLHSSELISRQQSAFFIITNSTKQQLTDTT